MKNLSLPVPLALLLAWSAMNGDASAFKRAARPLSVAVAEADSIVIARTRHVPALPARHSGGTAEIEVTEILKGGGGKGSLSVLLDEVHFMALGPLKQDTQYLFFLRSGTSPHGLPEVMLDGTREHSAEAADEMKAMIAATPVWSPAKDGLSTCLVADHYRLKKGEELTLYAVCRNLLDRKMTFTYIDWPLAAHSYWDLDVVPEGGQRIKPLKHPALTPESINEYFGRFHRSYDIDIKPKQHASLSIQRINTAVPGWGYKEELDFKYYPMKQPGCYQITARARNFSREMEAGGLRVWLE